MASALSGDQWVIRFDDQELTVVELGGGLRTYTRGGVDLLAGYGPDEVARFGRGQVLMPWPNRVRDGRYEFDGKPYQLALTEPALHNANHGLVRWLPWSLRSHQAHAMTVGATLFPQPGWDGLLELRVEYALDERGLRVTSTATNRGSVAVPFGHGAHPYIAIGSTPLAEVVLRLPAARQVLVDERMLPTETVPVPAEGDFRSPRALGSTSLDTAYTEVTRRADTGCWEVLVAGLRDRPDVTVWGDAAYEWFQVFTAKGADTGVDGARGVAVEPMSCPADAFNSGEGVVRLEPGQSWTGTWGISSADG